MHFSNISQFVQRICDGFEPYALAELAEGWNATAMGRRRKAWLYGSRSKHPGRRLKDGRTLPGFYVRYSDFSTGVLRNRTKTFLTLNNARAWVRQYNARLDLQQIGSVVPIPLPEAVEEYLRSGSWAPETGRQYGTTLGLFSRCVGDVNVCDIGRREMDRFIGERSNGSKATLSKHLRALKAFGAWCVKVGHAGNNFVELSSTRQTLQSPARDRPQVSEKQLAALVAGADTEDRRLALVIAMTTGMDRGAIEVLCRENIDVDGQNFVWRRQKTGKLNVVPIPRAFADQILRKHAETPPAQPLLRGLSHQKSEKDWWHQLRESVGLPSMMFRDLRAVATGRLQHIGGATLKDCQELLGHASIVTTAGHYHQPDPSLSERLRSLPVPGFPDTPELTTAKRTPGDRQES